MGLRGVSGMGRGRRGWIASGKVFPKGPHLEGLNPRMVISETGGLLETGDCGTLASHSLFLLSG